MNWKRILYLRMLEYRRAHPEKVKQWNQEYYQRNKEELKTKTLQWRHAHPEKVSEYNRTNRQRTKKARNYAANPN